jgi:adenine-specific DNA-methyltransferase
VTTRLELVWPNKDKFLLVPRDADGRPVWVEPSHPAASEVRLSTFISAVGTVGEDPQADNLLFTGDNLDVLRILAEVPEFRRHYRGKVKLVYIDPPFNTGQTFTHYDDWMEHSTWLSFMRDRLLLIKELLAPDGSVWVHLDDAEVHRMRVLMDEVFGAQTFISTVVWEKDKGRRNDTDISSAHDNILIYAPNPKLWRDTRNLLPRTAEHDSRYKNPDNDPRGPWLQGDNGTAKSGSDKARFPVTLPSGRVVAPPAGNYWRFSEETLAAAREDGRVWFGRKGDSLPVIKRYLTNVQQGVVPRTLWTADEVGTNQDAKRDHLRKMFPGLEPFATPKPEPLLERVVHIATNPRDIVLDCFGGSGTTAAVAHKMGRRWITCEVLPDTVAAFTRPRLEKVVAGEDAGGVTKVLGWEGGGGFRTVEVGPSMYETLDSGLVLLADWATNGKFSRAVAGQLGFEFEDAAPFCGRRGRMRLAVLDGAVGPEEVRDLVSRLEDKERLTIVAKVVLPDSEDTLAKLSPGSRIRKAPRDLLTTARRTRRVSAPAPGSTS